MDSEKKLSTNTNSTNKTKTKPIKLKPEKPILADVQAYFKEHGYTESTADRFFMYYNTADWHDSKGKQVKNWKQKAQAVWFKDEYKILPEKQKSFTPQSNNSW